MKRIRGTITHWNRRKAYGFITPNKETKEVFVHISEFRDRRTMPAIEEWVEYTLSTDKQGRPCATDVARVETLEEPAVEGGKWKWVVGAAIVLAAAAVLLVKLV